jgi:hypothetical protein
MTSNKFVAQSDTGFHVKILICGVITVIDVKFVVDTEKKPVTIMLSWKVLLLDVGNEKINK